MRRYDCTALVYADFARVDLCLAVLECLGALVVDLDPVGHAAFGELFGALQGAAARPTLRAVRCCVCRRTQIAQGRPKSWAKFRQLIGIPTRNSPSGALGVFWTDSSSFCSASSNSACVIAPPSRSIASSRMSSWTDGLPSATTATRANHTQTLTCIRLKASCHQAIMTSVSIMASGRVWKRSHSRARADILD